MRPPKLSQRSLGQRVKSWRRTLTSGASHFSPDLVDLRSKTDHPVEALYLSAGRPFLLNVPMTRCRTFGLALDRDNPLVRTLQDYGEGRRTKAQDSFLSEYYRFWQPATIADALGLPRETASGPLHQSPRNGLLLPWSSGASLADRTSRLARLEVQELSRELKLEPELIDGILYYGPVSDAFLMMTFQRLVRIYESIRQNGYRESDSDRMRGRLHLSGEEWRAHMISGKHRIAALVALGHEFVPLQIGPGVPVRRSEHRAWPNVTNRTFSPSEALNVFDRYFEGRFPQRASSR